ncbi:MAG: hypothetical protein IJW70_00855 [Clostridia bacterium]|nr:hypothetical protein [Clostridia bacterium]
MKFEKDTGGFEKVVDVATKCVDTADKVVNLVGKVGNAGRKVGKMKTSTKVGLMVGGALAFCLFPLRLAYDSETGEGEYKSLMVGVKRTQRPERSAQEVTARGTHSVSWELFPTVKVRPEQVDPCELPPAQRCEPVRAVPVQAHKVQKARPVVPVKLATQEEKA